MANMCDSSSYHVNYYLPPLVPGNYTPVSTSSTGVFPSVTDFAGALNFEIILNANESVKKKWLVSIRIHLRLLSPVYLRTNY